VAALVVALVAALVAALVGLSWLPYPVPKSCNAPTLN
jgi:hypothetical protein